MSASLQNLKNGAQQAAAALTHDAKAADLKKYTVDANVENSKLTTDHGTKVSNTDEWLKATNGETVGPMLLEDQIGREKIHRFDHERIPERVVHARGAGAHGHFKITDTFASKYTHAPVLTNTSRTTPVFVRFSTVQGARGSADTVRDVRGFAVKFYTDEGNWDIVGNDIPVFFIQESIKFPDIIHAVKPEPHNEVPQGQSAHNNFWDFVGRQTESAHMAMWVMSDRGIPRSLRMMQGFAVNTYTLINSSNDRTFVKFHFIPELGVHSFVWDEALKICGQDPDFHRKDLQEAIENGCPARWKFAIQVIEEKDEHNFDFDILDATKIWPEELVPLHVIGEMELNRTVEEFFSEVEQVAFCTSHVVPGIGFSDDPLLQGRNFSYFDTQISRLGINWEQLPINRPVCPVMNHHRGGKSNHVIHHGTVNYWPNRKHVGKPVPPANGGYEEFKQKVEGMKQRVRGKKFSEHFNQAQLFYNSMAPHEKAHIIAALSFELSHCDDPIVYKKYIETLNDIDFNLAKTVAQNVGGPVPDTPGKKNHGKKSAHLSQGAYMPEKPTIASRRIAILIADGFNLTEVESVRAAITAGKALPFLIGPRRGEIFPEGVDSSSKGKGLMVDHHFEGQRSTLFDALYIPSGAEHAKTLSQNGRTIHWVREAFGHCKTIGAVGEGVEFIQKALQLPELKFATPGQDKVASSYGVVTSGKFSLSGTAKDVLNITPDEKNFASHFAHEISKHRCWDRETDGLTSKVAY